MTLYYYLSVYTYLLFFLDDETTIFYQYKMLDIKICFLILWLNGRKRVALISTFQYIVNKF